ncbi:MAG: response regulator transcription factor [Anaerolineaceae bacterium]|nr:response regulator transcription factor [Anaerolineaceae bacterium]
MHAILAGAYGCILKDSDPEDLFKAIEEVRRGNLSVPISIARRLMMEKETREEPIAESFSEREMDVIKLLTKGLTNKEIGEKLFISPVTVRYHITSVLGKLNLSNRTQIVAYALKNNIINSVE